MLVYANVADAPLHSVALSAIVSRYAAGVDIQSTTPKPASTFTDRVRFFETHFQVVEDTPQVTEKLLSLIEQFSVGGSQIHDANIVATMQVYGIKHLLTHNISDFERFSDVITILHW